MAKGVIRNAKVTRYMFEYFICISLMIYSFMSSTTYKVAKNGKFIFFNTISLFIYNLVANFPLLLHQLKLYIEYHQEIQNIQSPDQKEVS